MFLLLKLWGGTEELVSLTMHRNWSFFICCQLLTDKCRLPSRFLRIPVCQDPGFFSSGWNIKVTRIRILPLFLFNTIRKKLDEIIKPFT